MRSSALARRRGFSGQACAPGSDAFTPPPSSWSRRLLIAAGAGGLALAGVIGFACHLGWQALALRGVDPQSGEAIDGVDALTLFRSNRDAGLILFAGLFAEALRLSIL